MERYLKTLEDKLHLLAEGEDIGLTPEEATVYGADYADNLPEDEQLEELDDE